MTIKKGDKVKIDYTGTLEDGTVFDTSEGKQPIEFEVGSGMVIPGFDAALVGMKKGEEKEISLPPEKLTIRKPKATPNTIPNKIFQCKAIFLMIRNLREDSKK